MAAGPDPPADGESDVRGLIRLLATRLAALELEREERREVRLEELRARRVVVVGEDGLERIVLGAHDKYGHVTVFSGSPGPNSTCVELFVTDPVDGDGAELGIALIDGGNTVASLTVFEGRRPRVWIDDMQRGPSSSPGE